MRSECSAQTRRVDTASRIEPPQPPPIDRRGGSALAFGVLRADAEAAQMRISETELADARGRREGRRAGGERRFPTGRIWC